MKNPMQIFEEMQQLETREEMIAYLQSLPKKDDPWPEETQREQCARCRAARTTKE